MSVSFGCLKSSCFAWTVERPFVGRSRMSPDLTYNGKKFHLELHTDCESFSLEMRGGKFYDAMPRHVVVQVEDCGGARPLSDSSLRYSFGTIWRFDESVILKSMYSFKSEGIFRFLVNFIDDRVKLANPDSCIGLTMAEEEKSVQTSAYMNALPCLESLSEDLSKLLEQGPEPDVLLTCGDLQVKAHRIILCTRSEVFAAMLNTDMAEKRTSTVNIRDMNQEAFDHFVRYLYSGKLQDLTVDIAKGLYEAADKYAIKALMKRCASCLFENLDPENALEMLELADAHNEVDFKESVMEYILQKQIHLQPGDSWPDFCKRQPVLANEVLNRYCRGTSGSSATHQQKRPRIS